MFRVGQRWMSLTETSLGLGTVQEVQMRVVQLFFPAVDEVRNYAINNAPLHRMAYKVGDTVQLEQGSLKVEFIKEHEGILFYGNDEQMLPETALSAQLTLDRALDRLHLGQFDGRKAYRFRAASWQHSHRLNQSPAFGLLGGKTILLPHQLYIANEVASRPLPRVLLADEVGLGKTIEAAMIINRLLVRQQAQRVLILLPNNLLNQWLVEFRRRFNLNFSIIDDAVMQDHLEDNVFDSFQQVLVPIDDLLSNPHSVRHMLETDWDIMVVDEAHHLEWSEQMQTGNLSYDIVEAVAEKTPGVLLLTATPEQMGAEGHFARLRLLDPARYHDMAQFVREEEQLQQLTDLAKPLAAGDELTESARTSLQAMVDVDLNQPLDEQQREDAIDQLVDRHGTGRVLFRNTRSAITGFPKRCLHRIRLPQPQIFDRITDYDAALYPERELDNWHEDDPRLPWLKQHLSGVVNGKTLLIVHDSSIVLEIYEWLRLNTTVACAVFHEQMTLLERDRAAAYFASEEESAELLICSEIGSEGRNFQFAKHLVLFDLPLNCDLLEQRIGRLDRIGQRQDVEIYVPTLEGSPSDDLADIYESGLGLFRRTNPAAQSLWNKYFERAETVLKNNDSDEKIAFITELAAETETVLQQLEQGRDWLLERNSCHPERANDLLELLVEEEALNAAPLQQYIDNMCTLYGLENEELDPGIFHLQPGTRVMSDMLPRLPEHGFSYALNRKLAAGRDDLVWMTWEHPIIQDALELTQSNELGNCSVALLEEHPYKSGQFYLELGFVVHTQAPKALQVGRYLAENQFSITVSPEGDWFTNEPVELEGLSTRMPRNKAKPILDHFMPSIDAAVKHGTHLAEQYMPAVMDETLLRVDQHFDAEIARLKALSLVNPSIRPDEIDYLANQKNTMIEAFESAQLELDHIQLVFCR